MIGVLGVATATPLGNFIAFTRPNTSPFHGTLGSLQQYALKRPLPGLNRNTLCFTMQAGGYTYLPRKTSIGAGDNKQLQ